MPANALLDQAEKLLAHYRPDSEPYRVLSSLIAAARKGPIPQPDIAAAVELRDKLPGSTISLTVQRIIQGETEPLDTESLGRWVNASNKGKR